MYIYTYSLSYAPTRWNVKFEWCYHNVVGATYRAIQIRWARKLTTIVLWKVRAK